MDDEQVREVTTVTTPPRIPEAVDGIQVNFCKNPCCLNFGVPASLDRQSRGPKFGADSYIVTAKSSTRMHAVPMLKCKHCGEKPTIKSNLAIAEELRRFWPTPPYARTSTGCPKPSCPNHGIEVSKAPHCYSSHSRLSSGGQRYRCKRCGKVFTHTRPVNPANKQGIHKHKNISVFKMLVAKVPFKRISELESFSMVTLYQKLNFLFKQCKAFAASRETALPGMEMQRLRISVDRQDYVINWNNTNDKRNVTLHCVASADNDSGYIFGAHLDYDPAMDPLQVEQDAQEIGDYDLRAPYRRYARLWLAGEQLPEPREEQGLTGDSDSILDKVRYTYATALARPDIEVAEETEYVQQLPKKGMQTHSEYAIYGHFQFLRRLLARCKKYVFYLDQESGIRAACHSAFWDRILDKSCDAFYVTIDKDLTIHEKKRLKQQSDRELSEFIENNKYLSDASISDIRLFFIRELLKETVPAGKWSDEWLVYPFPDMSEPKKAVAWLTDLKDRAYNDFELAELYLGASLHGIDRFFMQMRRLTSPLERPIATASSARRVWHAYAPYNPHVTVQLIEIFRIYYNYVKVGKDGKTPAMRIGLAKGRVRFEDVVYFGS